MMHLENLHSPKSATVRWAMTGLLGILVVLASKPNANAQPWKDMNYGPFMTSTIEVDQGNAAFKGITIRLDGGPGGVAKGNAFVAFDTDTLRMAAGWLGHEPIDWKSVVFDGSHQTHPALVGQRVFLNPVGPGWANPSSGSFTSSRVVGVDGRKYGPLDRAWAHWKGLYLHKQRVVLSYTVGETLVLETPSLEGQLEEPYITRTLNVGPRTQDLILQVAGHSGRLASKKYVAVNQHRQPLALLVQGSDEPINRRDENEEGFGFDGRQHFQVDRSDDFRMTDADFTVTAQIKTSDGGTILSKAPAGEWVPNAKTLFVRGGRLCYDIGWAGVVQSRRRVNDGKWHDVAIAYSASEGVVQLFVDGQTDQRQKLRPKAGVRNHQMRIGYTSNDFPSERGFVGRMRRVQFFQRALALEELERDAAVQSDRVAEWQLSAESSSGITDASGNGHGAKLTGVPAAKREVEGLAVSAVGDTDSLEWITTDTGMVQLKIAAGQQPLRIKLLYAALEKDLELAPFAAHLGKTAMPEELAALTGGGPARWPQRLTTRITTTSSSDSPFEVETLETPESNPWDSWMRLGGFDFFADQDRAAACTWQGDVWLVEGLKRPSATIRWQRVATGLFQPLGLKIVDGQIYVLGRDQITKIHDLNGDGEADFYENFNNDAQVTDHFHEFAMDLQTDSAGNFYYAKAARHALPALVPQHGTLMMVAKDGSESRVLARGFRAPNGLLVNDDGSYILSDQEGHWTPMNRINWVRPGGFYGNMMAFNPDGVKPDETEPPVVWIHREIDRSPAAQVWVPENTWGSLGGALLNLSYGTGKIYQILYQDTGKSLQGGVFELPIPDFPTGIQRGRFHGEWLYVCGLFGWSSDKTKPGGLYRMRATGQPVDLPEQLHLTRDGVSLQFPYPLDKDNASDPRNYVVSRWNYRRTANYGSEDYRVSDGRPGRDPVPISSVSLSDDGRGVFLHIPTMQLCDQMRVRYRVRSERDSLVAGLLDTTVLDLPETDSDVRARFGDRWGKMDPIANEAERPRTLNPGLLLRIANTQRPDEVVVRVSRLIALENQPGQRPDVMLKAEPFEAVWDGFVSVDLSDQARFEAEVIGDVQLELNGHPIALKRDKSGIVCSEPVGLRSGLNRIRVSLTSRENGKARLRLHWETNERVLEPVDPSSLLHDPARSMQLHDSQLMQKGRELFATMNCGRCHAFPINEELNAVMPELGRDSPSLANVGQRFGRQWLNQWIERPHAMRNQISMPQVIPASADVGEIADLVAYLETLRTDGDSAPASEPRDEDELIEQGLVLYEDLGCIGCHHFEKPDSEDPYDRISLRFVADKYQDGYLLRFLLRPHAHYAWRKMPDFQLTDDEARSIATYVRDCASPVPAREFADGNASRGKQIFEDRGCAACHAVDDSPLEWEDELRPVFANAHRNKGCLAQEDVQRATAPQFQLTREDREALQAFVQTDGESLNHRHLSAAAERHIEQLGCATCHRRDAAAPTLPIALLEEGEQGHPPELLPPLTWTGEKLFTPWITQLLRGELKKKSRPWLKGRMPAFPAYAEVLAHGIVQQHAVEAKQMESVVANPDLIRVGEKLISKDEGFHCLQCHAVPGKDPEGAFESQGIDFDLIPTRIRHEYFRRWLANPPQVDPSTKMPRFSPDGKTTPVTNVLDGQADRQFEALWQYIHSLDQPSP